MRFTVPERCTDKRSWQLLVDVSRQLMHDFHIFDFDGIATSADCLRMTVLAMLRVMEEAPEVGLFTSNVISEPG